jgi:uncharacterized protein
VSTSAFLSVMAGDLPHYEEACRALFAGEDARLAGLVGGWPRDVRDHVLARAEAASDAERRAV